MDEKRLKIDLELHVVGDGRTFLNFWNSLNGDDVIVEIIDGKLIRCSYQDERIGEEMSLNEFVEEVKSKF